MEKLALEKNMQSILGSFGKSWRKEISLHIYLGKENKAMAYQGKEIIRVKIVLIGQIIEQVHLNLIIFTTSVDRDGRYGTH